MADIAPSTSRRALLGSFALASLIPTAAIAVPHTPTIVDTGWQHATLVADRANAALRTLKDDAVAARRPDFDDRFDDLCGVATDANYALLAVPAPNVAAAAEKLARFMKHEVYDDECSAEMLGHLLADLNRLAAREVR